MYPLQSSEFWWSCMQKMLWAHGHVPVILFLTRFSTEAGKSNVLLGLVIAGLGIEANSFFWIGYNRLNKELTHAIYAAKANFMGRNPSWIWL